MALIDGPGVAVTEEEKRKEGAAVCGAGCAWAAAGLLWVARVLEGIMGQAHLFPPNAR